MLHFYNWPTWNNIEVDNSSSGRVSVSWVHGSLLYATLNLGLMGQGKEK